MANYVPRVFDADQAKLIRDFTNEKKTSIDRGNDDFYKELLIHLKELGYQGHDYEELRSICHSERRISWRKNGPEPYLNQNGQWRGPKQANDRSQSELEFDSGMSFEWINVDELSIPEEYQRAQIGLGNSVNEDNFDWASFGALIVARTDDSLNVVDGIQRLKTARALNYQKVPCIVHDSRGVCEEARTFSDINVRRRSVNALVKFNAGYVSGNPNYVDCHEMLIQNGFRVPSVAARPTDPDCHPLKCIAVYIDEFNKRDRRLDPVEETLKLMYDLVCIDHGWNVRYFHGAVLLLYKNHFHRIDSRRLFKILKNISPHDLAAVAKKDTTRRTSVGLGGGGLKYYALAIQDIYNHKLSANKRLPYDLEDEDGPRS